MNGIHRILVATDLSEFSPVLLLEAANLAWQCHAELTVLHVFGSEDYLRVLEETRLPIDEYVELLRMRMRREVTGSNQTGVGVSARFEVREAADVVEEIIFEAARAGADLIVMGTHGRSGLARVLLGSVAAAVLQRAPVPVLVVPLILSHPHRIVDVDRPLGVDREPTGGNRPGRMSKADPVGRVSHG